MKRMMGLLLAAALLLLCACTRSEKEQQAKPVTLRVVTSFGSEDGNRRNFEAAVAAYEASTGNLWPTAPMCPARNGRPGC